ncbi:hypothetical protein EJD97_004563, partial [Solanum chilense]
MFKVTHVKKSTNPREEERWIEPHAQDTCGKIDFLNIELDVVDDRVKRQEKERKRDEEIAAAKEVQNKRYAAHWVQLNFLFESENIFPPCPASSDGSNQMGDENNKSQKKSESDEQ